MRNRNYHRPLQEAEFVANEFNNLTSVQSAEVVPNVNGYYSVLVTITDGRRAVSCELDTADGALTVVKIEEAYAHTGYATLGEGNVPVFCSRETWKAWWEVNPGGKVVKSELSGCFVTEITFTGFSSERDRPLKFWTVDSRNTQTRMCYSLGSFATLEEAIASLESTKGPSSD